MGMEDPPPRNIPLKSAYKIVLQDGFSEHSGNRLTLVSDVSVHITNTASGVWQLYADQDKRDVPPNHWNDKLTHTHIGMN